MAGAVCEPMVEKGTVQIPLQCWGLPPKWKSCPKADHQPLAMLRVLMGGLNAPMQGPCTGIVPLQPGVEGESCQRSHQGGLTGLAALLQAACVSLEMPGPRNAHQQPG